MEPPSLIPRIAIVVVVRLKESSVMQKQQQTVQSRKLWCVVLAALALALSAGGCQNGKEKNHQEATARWNKARASVMASLANDQFRAGNLEECRRTVNAALKLDPRNPSLHILSARLGIEQGLLEAAEHELEEARKVAPEAADVLGKLLEKDGFKDRADLLAALGQAQLQTGKPRDARRSFETATEKDPSSSKIWLGLARAAMEANDFKRSELALRKAHSLEPKASEAYLLHGYLR